MINMVDEIFDRQFQAGRADLFDGIERAVARVAKTVVSGFATLQRIQFDAPWVSKNQDAGLA
jgi:acetaldehyde dehydrogenase (acetylating)